MQPQTPLERATLFAQRFDCRVLPVIGKAPAYNIAWSKSTTNPLKPWSKALWKKATGFAYIADNKLLIVDIDKPHEVPYYIKEALAANPTYTAQTPGGVGRERYIFKNTLGLKRKRTPDFGEIIVGVNYAVGSGSIHPDNDKVYPEPYLDIELADAPQAILRTSKHSEDYSNEGMATKYGPDNPAPHGMHDLWLSAYAARRSLQLFAKGGKKWAEVREEVRDELEDIVKEGKCLADYDETKPYTEADFDRISRSGMRAAKQLRKKENKEKAKLFVFVEEEKPNYNSATFERHLGIVGYDLRYNIRGKRTEIWSKANPEWKLMSDRDEAKMWDDIRKNIAYFVSDTVGYREMKVTSEDRRMAIQAYTKDREVDPFLEWLESLPKWDGVDRLDSLLDDLFELHKDTDTAIAQWLARATFLAPIWRAYQPGHYHDEMPILIGKSDAGKSRFFQYLFPREWQFQWFTSGLDLSASLKEIVEATDGKVICEYAELMGMKKAQIERLKALQSTEAYNATRTAYARNAEERPLMFLVVGTSNDYTCLPNDPTGLRRFVPVVIEDGNPVNTINYMEANREQLWAEAMLLFSQGVDSGMPPHLKDNAAIAAAAHRDADIVAEDIVQLYIKDNPHNISVSAVVEYSAISHTSVSAYRIRKALMNAGYILQRKYVNGKQLRVFNPHEEIR